MYCEKCGNQTNDNDNFCEKCGNKLNNQNVNKLVEKQNRIDLVNKEAKIHENIILENYYKYIDSDQKYYPETNFDKKIYINLDTRSFIIEYLKNYGVFGTVYESKEYYGDKHLGLTKGVATLSLGLVGFAVTNSNELKTDKVPVSVTVKVVPNGVVISTKNRDNLKIPFNDILNVDCSSIYEVNNINMANIKINLKDNNSIKVNDCKNPTFIYYLVNKLACGVEEEGWV
ncbi:zinc ribbon domain-containing protein [Methanobrevibacter sp. DSM 116169]|uniref:zinc ribbon domain-containing protein n=1 Tax=Methanobrevibacter sp. DSM 116169 TaxID=3242727 RepID=UPI0038FCA663